MLSDNTLSSVVIVLTSVAGIYSLIDFRMCPERKKLLRLFGCVLSFYLASAYIIVMFFIPFATFPRFGMLAHYGIVILSTLYILEIWAARRGQGHNYAN